MKVLIVTGIFPPDIGGPARHVPILASNLVKNGYDVTGVITLADNKKSGHRVYNFKVVRISRSQNRFIRTMKLIWEIYKLSKGADVVYLNGLVFEGILAAKVGRQKPCVVKVVGDLVWEKYRISGTGVLEIDEFQKASLPRRWSGLRKLQSAYMKMCSAVITPSNYLAAIARGWGVREDKINVIYNSVDKTETKGKKLGRNTFDIITVARLVPWKGLASLINVASELDLSLRIVGDGPLSGELEQLANDLRANVSFAGRVSQLEVLNEIRNARLFVLNSSYEGLPHIVLEAKATGVAVIASDAGGIPETINHGVDGWLVPTNNDHELRYAIKYLLENEDERVRLAEGAYRQLSNMFDIEEQNLRITQVLLNNARK